MYCTTLILGSESSIVSLSSIEVKMQVYILAVTKNNGSHIIFVAFNFLKSVLLQHCCYHTFISSTVIRWHHCYTSFLKYFGRKSQDSPDVITNLSATASKRSGRKVPSVSMYIAFPSPPPRSIGSF